MQGKRKISLNIHERVYQARFLIRKKEEFAFSESRKKAWNSCFAYTVQLSPEFLTKC